MCGLVWVQSVHEGRIYTLKLFCDKDYPDKPPTVRFHSRINMTHVNQETGLVSLSLNLHICIYGNGGFVYWSLGISTLNQILGVEIKFDFQCSWGGLYQISLRGNKFLHC